MHFLEDYRDALRDSFEEARDLELGTFKKLGLGVLVVMSVRQDKADLRNMYNAPRVPSPEMTWHGPDLEREVLERELEEIFNES